jgi:hypothetical protein
VLRFEGDGDSVKVEVREYDSDGKLIRQETSDVAKTNFPVQA